MDELCSAEPCAGGGVGRGGAEGTGPFNCDLDSVKVSTKSGWRGGRATTYL